MEEKRFDRAPETGRGASVRSRSRGLRSRKRTSDYPFRRRSCPRSTPSGFRPLTGATSGRAFASSPRVFSGARADLPSRPSAALPARPSTPCPHRPCHPPETLARYPRAPFMWADEGRTGHAAAVSEGALPSQSPQKSVFDRVPPRHGNAPFGPFSDASPTETQTTQTRHYHEPLTAIAGRSETSPRPGLPASGRLRLGTSTNGHSRSGPAVLKAK